MDSELVIACHCKEKHAQLFFYNPDGSSRPLEGETYVDPRACPDRTWDKIPSNSKQIVWGENCPVYFAFTKNEDKQLKQILEESYRVLKPGGCVIFPAGREGFELEDFKHRPEVEGFKLEIRPNDGLPVNILRKRDGRPKKEIKLLIIYTKIAKGGRKMRLKTIRRSHKPEKKWDAVFEKDNCKEKVVSFGAHGMSDYTKHKDTRRRSLYLKRHSGMGEHWDQPDTPGALSRWILWNKKTLKASLKDFKRKFKV